MRTLICLCHPSSIVILIFSVVILALPGKAKAQSPPSYTQLNTWSFDDTNWLSAYQYAPVSFSGLVNTNKGNGHCLLLSASAPAWLQYHVFENDSAVNLRVDRGTVLFWFSPLWSGTNVGGAGPGTWARLFELGHYTPDASVGWWSLHVDPQGTHLYFSTQTNNGSGATYLSAPIAWTNGDWHCIALTYSSTNTTLYLDGKFAANGTPMAHWPGTDIQAGGFFVGSDSSGQLQAHGMFDDLATFDQPLDASSLTTIATLYSIAYEPSPFPFSFSNAPSSPNPLPGLNAIVGSGFLQPLGNTMNCVSDSNIWSTNISCAISANQSATLTFSIEGGSSGVFYDVFANGLLGPTTSTNYHWAWVGQGLRCHRYKLENLPLPSGIVILGTPLDSDFDGLTDAYENLISHTDSSNPDTDDDGISDAEEILSGLFPLTADPPLTLTPNVQRCPL